MKRKVLSWSDNGHIEFSPPLPGYGDGDFKDWMDPDEYELLPEIDDDGLVKEYEETFKGWDTACKKIIEGTIE